MRLDRRPARNEMSSLRDILVPFDVLIEGATGLALMAVPALIARLLLGADLPEIGAVTARVAGIALVALVLGCWLGRQARGGICALAALLAYNTLITVYLGWLGIGGVFIGLLLWPVVVFHALVMAMLAVALWQSRRAGHPADT
ncbi:hypothetical protein [Mycobacterium sp. KBS0706]|uniref:hypothetical protein n=1 Tax=Mycobacterium sp. KBS0706 TaxID=2578109 RepID=UPI001C8F5A9A|nr:hypothetical protein [Mycobacterium sp. KBS0706]